MSRILVAEDSATQAAEIRMLLEEAGFEVDLCAHGLEALESVRRALPDLVLADLNMPVMDGLALVEAVRSEHAHLPVIVIAESGSEEIAVRALDKGAATYLPKRNLYQDIVKTIDEVLVTASAHRYQEWIFECLTQTESRFILDNDQNLIPPLIGYLQQNLRRTKLCDERCLISIAVAVNEALTNAIYHGNLEVGSELRNQDEERYFELVNERLGQRPYRDRRIHFSARETGAEAVYVVRDEGPGFDPSHVPDPTAPENLMLATGRGLLLIRAFMDEVSHNAAGNEITMIKRRVP